MELADFGIEEAEGGFRRGDSPGQEELSYNLRKVCGSSQRGGFFRARCADLPALRWRGERWFRRGLTGGGLRSGIRLEPSVHKTTLIGRGLQIFVFTIGVVDDDVAEALDAFQQLLIALVPLGGGFVEEDDALVDEA